MRPQAGNDSVQKQQKASLVDEPPVDEDRGHLGLELHQPPPVGYDLLQVYDLRVQQPGQDRYDQSNLQDGVQRPEALKINNVFN